MVQGAPPPAPQATSPSRAPQLRGSTCTAALQASLYACTGSAGSPADPSRLSAPSHQPPGPWVSPCTPAPPWEPCKPLLLRPPRCWSICCWARAGAGREAPTADNAGCCFIRHHKVWMSAAAGMACRADWTLRRADWGLPCASCTWHRSSTSSGCCLETDSAPCSSRHGDHILSGQDGCLYA